MEREVLERERRGIERERREKGEREINRYGERVYMFEGWDREIKKEIKWEVEI